ncbi:MAG: hypothetical protein HFF17_13380 [Oscillospiraceae bacterium]|nr:hypothetical protein [Oscillospiraceae bacterium]
MNWRLFVFIFYTFLLFCFTGCKYDMFALKMDDAQYVTSEVTEPMEDENDMVSQYRLFVNGKDITNGRSIQKECEHISTIPGVMWEHDSCYIMLPYISILEELGAKIDWVSAEIATVKFCDSEYILNIAEGSMRLAGDTEDDITGNYIRAGYGGLRHFRMEHGEFLLDHATVNCSFQIMGTDIRVFVNLDNMIIIESTSEN